MSFLYFGFGFVVGVIVTVIVVNIATVYIVRRNMW